MENANLIKRFRETYTELSANMTDDQVLHWLEHHDEEYEYLAGLVRREREKRHLRREMPHGRKQN